MPQRAIWRAQKRAVPQASMPTTQQRAAPLELNALVQRVVVTEDRRRSAEELARQWTQLSADEILQSPYVLIGTVEQIIEDLRAHWERWGISYYNVHEPLWMPLPQLLRALQANSKPLDRSRQPYRSPRTLN